ncbi:hypothetical protein, partial [Bacteroides congonensis]|uniref:hypothetical protein n=1 Tax=Bacteroides congonensis TaxID=1871006 RepID=UPI0024B11C36
AFGFIIAWKETRTRPNAYHSANIMLTISIRYSVVFVFLYPHISRNTKALVLAGASFFVSVNSVKDVKDKKEDF